MLRNALLVVLAAAALGAIYIRMASMTPERWHVDPVAAPSTGRPNEARATLQSDLPPTQALARYDAVALAAPRTERLAGSPEEGRVTYVQRSAVLGFPDAITVQAEPRGGGTTLHVWSRARYGYSDMGVNAKRLAEWNAAFER